MSDWVYREAFGRNIGLVSVEEQEILRRSHVAIAGMGGAGGIHLVTLTRLGVGNFTIADPDTYGVANTNRQYGAKSSTVGRNKAEVMAEIAKDINPEVNITITPGYIDEHNVDDFLKDANVFLDGIDVFSIDARRLVYRKAAEKGLHAVSAGPMGFSAGWMVFDPKGVSFDDYFDLHDGMSEAEQFITFVAGIAPAGMHLKYIDKSKVDFKERRGPSLGMACALVAGVAACEVTKVLLGRGKLWPIPYYQQFDPYLGKFKRGRLWLGNRHPKQRLKRWYLMNYAKKNNMLPEIQPASAE